MKTWKDFGMKDEPVIMGLSMTERERGCGVLYFE